MNQKATQRTLIKSHQIDEKLVAMLIYLPAALKAELEARARADNRKLSNLCRLLLARAVAEPEPPAP